jgi:hypothetical protein
MIKVFDTTSEFETYSAGGLKSGELCYVAEDKTAHFRTNNIDGIDKEYDMSEGGGSDEPEYTALNLNTFTVDSRGKNFSTMITATVGQTIEIYNPNHLNFQVGQGEYYIDPVTGELSNLPTMYQNGISTYDPNFGNYLEHLYVQNAPNNMEGGYSENGFCIGYYSQAGTPVDGVIYYRIIDA